MVETPLINGLYQSWAKNLNTAPFNNLAQTAQSAQGGANAMGGFLGNMNEFLGSQSFGNVSGAIGGIGSIIQGLGGWDSARKSLKEQKRMNNLLHEQYNEEKRRYNEYKAERDSARDMINASAKLYKV